MTIFSQYGEPTYINLVRDKETGKSKGFCFLKYEDQRSCDLAVDNLSGAQVLGRMLSVDHTRYKKRDDEEIFDNTNGATEEVKPDEVSDERERKHRRKRSESEEARPLLKEERELAELRRNHDDDDPMKEFLIQEKQEEVSAAIAEYERNRKRERKEKHRHHSRHHYRRDHERREGRSSPRKPTD